MGDLIQRFVDFIREFWPLRTVMAWEAGNIYRLGKYWKTVGPGMYFVIPFFWDVRTDSVVRSTYVTTLQTIDTKDGGTLTFSAAVQLEVSDFAAAQLKVHAYDETAMEDTSALLADTLMRATPRQLEIENRAELLRRCTQQLETELGEYGLTVLSLRFNNFVRNMRVYRLFNDQIYTSSN
jgi:regulator of protease activity HflC (stomatin/prohibitin superfamily)